MKHILAKSVSCKDPRLLFQDINAHFQFHHVDKAIKTISKHPVYPGTFERDMANFRIDIADLTHAQNAKVLEQQKFAYLKELLTHDTRRLLRCGIQIQLGQQIRIHYTHVLFGWILKLRTLPRMFWNLLRKEGTRSSLRPLETNKLGVLQNVWSDW